MIDLLILYMVSSREFTMYGIQKGIESEFGVYTRPSFGALKPALRRLEFNDFLSTRN
uniref:PadR family transcriptional regulator n=1 Tax=Candidatus Scatousia sp. TaxID=3085663 RepID=UPI00402809C0